ncbi:hypothetical protein HDU87_001213 [Geranomyces variabilis]|uniref:Protein kinase domain-containing protein n=1 Tax=Geranomyces variabilis TaxID=109894 RepID=A0AAD5XLE5_9FUNG|nr:hypothetical protein HDU87_001213 [Geranomyces variabilis]
MRPHSCSTANPAHLRHAHHNCIENGRGRQQPSSAALQALSIYPRDLEFLNRTLHFDFIRPEDPVGPTVTRSEKLRNQYILAQQAPAAAADAATSGGHNEPYRFPALPPSSEDAAAAHHHALKNMPSNSYLSASLAAAAAAGNYGNDSSASQQQQQQWGQVGLGFSGANIPPVRDDNRTLEQPSLRWSDSRGGRAGGTSPKTMRQTAQSANYALANSISPRKPAFSAYPPNPSPFLKSKTAPVGTLPVMIPGGGSPHPGQQPTDDIGSSLDRSDSQSSITPPSSESSPNASAHTGADLNRTWSWNNSRPGDVKLGMHRPRHSLSVSIVRRRANSLASSPVTSGSFSSLQQSPAVSFLASLADMSIASEPVRGEYREGDQVGDFLLGPEIGAGAFSRVFEAEVIDGPHKHLGKVAIKIVIKDQPTDEGCKDVQRFLDHETTIWSRLRHPHVLEMLELMDAEDAVFVVSELVTGGNLLEYIRAQGKLPEEVARKLFRQVASALRYLHEEIQVIHRDVKCENILLDANGDAKLADFGLSTDMTPNDTPASSCSPMLPDLSSSEPVFLMGSIHYCAPEELRQTTRNSASDMWSLGCVLFAMLTGSLPFNDGFIPRLQLSIQNGRWDQAKLNASGCSEAAKEVVRGLLRPKVAERWGANELWASDWLKGT